MRENEHYKSGTVYYHLILFSVCAIFLLNLLLIVPVSAFNDYSGPWILVNASAEWTPRLAQSSVVMPDDSIVLMGGLDNVFGPRNDVWQSMDYGAIWTRVNASAGWTARYDHCSVVMPDGSIALMGGWDGSYKNDTWLSTDHGATWTLKNASSGWTARNGHSSVALPDGSIVLMGGVDATAIHYRNDVWRSTDQGSTWTQMNTSAGWTPRVHFKSVAMSDGSIVLMGGQENGLNNYLNDVWLSSDKGLTWTQVKYNDGNGWTARNGHSSVATPDGSIVLTGGGPGTWLNDTWQSTNYGATWTLKHASSGWARRTLHTSVAMSDGSIVLMGGGGGGTRNDVWRLMPNQTTDCQPMPVANFMSTQTTVPVGVPVSFTDQSTPQWPSLNYVMSWSWDFGDGGTSSAQNPSHSFNSAGLYTVTLTASNACGSSTLIRSLYINVTSIPCPPPTVNFYANPISGQAPLTVHFTDTSNLGTPPYHWTWTFGDGSQPDITQNPTHVYQNAGHYLATLTVQNACGTNTTSSYIDVTNSSGSCCCCCSACSTCPPITGCGDNVIQLFGMPINIWLIIWTILVAVLIAGIVYYLIKRAED
jgi:PKD repeat protein